jgi:hypothetical protein
MFRGISINKGDRSEILIILLFTAAQDKSVGPPAEHTSGSGSPILSLFQNPPETQPLIRISPTAKSPYLKVVRCPPSTEYQAVVYEILRFGVQVVCRPFV